MAIIIFLLAGVAIIAIIALARTREIPELQRELTSLRRRVRRLENRDVPVERDQPAPIEMVEPQSPVEILREMEPPEARPAERKSWLGEVDWESWIGGRGLGWTAVILLLFAVGFFLQYALEQGWIGPTGRIAIAVLAGVLLCGGGVHYHRKHWRIFSQILSSGGIVLLYLCTYASFGYYELIPQTWAGVFLTILVAESMLLAFVYDAPAIANMAVLGGLLNPLLLHSIHDQYVSLFLYLIVLNLGVAVLAVWRPWQVFATLSLIGTHALFWVWYGQHHHPEKLSAALLFQVVLAVLYVGQLCAGIVRRTARVEELVRLVLASVLFVGAAYTLLEPDYHDWLGAGALLLATIYLALAWWLLRRTIHDERPTLVVVALVMGLVAVVFPLELESNWVALGWAVQGLALWLFGLRILSLPLRQIGVALGALAAFRLVFIDTPFAHGQPFLPLINGYAVPALAVTACILLFAISARKNWNTLSPFDETIAWLAGIGGLLLIWLILSVETWQYFHTQITAQAQSLERWTGVAAQRYGQPFPTYIEPVADKAIFLEREDVPMRPLQVVDEHGVPIEVRYQEQARDLARLAQTWLSIVWTVFAIALLAVGFWQRLKPVRWAALAVFAATLIKVVCVDMAELPALYRVATFTVLALMMGAGGWVYNRVLAQLTATSNRENS